MGQIRIVSASYVGPRGYGNSRRGFAFWPPHIQALLQKGELAGLHWSVIFSSDPARFERMDLMSRLGLMAVELLEAGFEHKSSEERDKIGVCVETCAGSLGTDVRFLQTPRASIFTYTLPSTVIGEICIRYRLRGPVLCLVAPAPEGSGVLAEAADWLEQNEADACLCVGCEAVDQDCAAHLPDGVAAYGWHGCAALVDKTEACFRGEGPTSPGSQPNLASSALIQICQSLCSFPKQT